MVLTFTHPGHHYDGNDLGSSGQVRQRVSGIPRPRLPPPRPPCTARKAGVTPTQMFFTTAVPWGGGQRGGQGGALALGLAPKCHGRGEGRGRGGVQGVWQGAEGGGRGLTCSALRVRRQGREVWGLGLDPYHTAPHPPYHTASHCTLPTVSHGTPVYPTQCITRHPTGPHPVYHTAPHCTLPSVSHGTPLYPTHRITRHPTVPYPPYQTAP